MSTISTNARHIVQHILATHTISRQFARRYDAHRHQQDGIAAVRPQNNILFLGFQDPSANLNNVLTLKIIPAISQTTFEF